MTGSYIERTIYLNQNELIINERYFLEDSKKMIEEKYLYYLLENDLVKELSNNKRREVSSNHISIICLYDCSFNFKTAVNHYI